MQCRISTDYNTVGVASHRHCSRHLVCWHWQAIRSAAAGDNEITKEQFEYLITHDYPCQLELKRIRTMLRDAVGSTKFWVKTDQHRSVLAFNQPWRNVIQQLTNNMNTRVR